LDRILIRAPADGEVLQANVRPGEFAAAGSQADPPMVLGNLDQLHVRVDIDENDAWRFRRDARAMANLRGNPKFKAELTLAYVEPMWCPSAPSPATPPNGSTPACCRRCTASTRPSCRPMWASKWTCTSKRRRPMGRKGGDAETMADGA
ncbi:HlyD family efflux transporter periplasmic adaptor subunit, partial [Methylogaea oryzae]|uniref:HlyD family efflux transporter periplasmic adaptor subunit n=1 Tax=Methylogaea oryzae TaxID=1295382 RepID=UPI0020D156DA